VPLRSKAVDAQLKRALGLGVQNDGEPFDEAPPDADA
jgi:hypothetical protein